MSSAAARSGGGASSAATNQRAVDFRRQVRLRVYIRDEYRVRSEQGVVCACVCGSHCRNCCG